MTTLRHAVAGASKSPSRSGPLVFVALALVGAFFTLFYALPLFEILRRGATWTSLREVLGDDRTWKTLWFTTWQAALSTIVTFVVGLPIANIVARYRFRGRTALRVLATVPFVLPTVVVGSAFLSIERALNLDDGPLAIKGTVWGIVIAHVFFNVAVVVRSVGGWWAQLDDRPEAAARTLGAGPVMTFWTVTLPRLRPSILASSAIVFLFSFTSFGVILLLGNLRKVTIETEIWRFATQRTDFATAATLGLLQLAVVVAMLVVNARLQGAALVTEATRPPAEIERSARTTKDRLRVGAGVGLTVVILGAPILVLIERSLATADGYGFDYYRALGEHDQRIPLLPTSAWSAVSYSVSLALLATVIATLVGTVAALITTGAHRRLAQAVDVALLLPLGTSAVLVGFGMLIALDTPPIDWRTSWWIVPVAQALIGIPFVMRSVATALRAIDPALREAAATMGASPGQVWREIDLPIASRAVVAGAAFAFAISVGEFGATTFLARPARPTVPTAIFSLLGRPGELAFGQAMALSVILVAMTGAAVIVIEQLRTAVAGEL